MSEQKNTAFDHPESDSVKGHERETPNKRSREAYTWLPGSNCDIVLRERRLSLGCHVPSRFPSSKSQRFQFHFLINCHDGKRRRF